MAAKKAKAATAWPEVSVVLRMIEKNMPLSQWRAFVETGSQGTGYYHKNHEKMAAAIFRQLSHPEAVAIVGHEWDQLGPEIRMVLGTLAADGNASGNVKKGCQALNHQVGGRLLRAKVDITARVAGKTIRVDPAKAGATRKYGVDDPRFQVRHW
jgi:hypothetical protein